MTIAQALIEKGVAIPTPQTVEFGGDVDVDRIASGATIHSGCKIYGASSYIAEGAVIGYEGPATIVNCYVGPDASLNTGYYQDAVFLKKTSCGSGSHIRPGTILEEHSSVAHTVGLKQTILFPFVTLGSLINFCDCLMAGGTDRKNHSEVGSSYIHFNYTPNQDKATPSLMGDVPRGVMLNQSPIFLGGQGGLVGPCRLAYGTVVAAGTICRKDQLKENHLVIEAPPRSARVPFMQGTYTNLKRILRHNVNYIGQLFALRQWYIHTRSQFVGQGFPQAILDGLKMTIDTCIAERVKQLESLGQKVLDAHGDNQSPEIDFFKEWAQKKAMIDGFYAFHGDVASCDLFLKEVEGGIDEKGKDYIAVMKGLKSSASDLGSQWLRSIVDHIADELLSKPDIGSRSTRG